MNIGKPKRKNWIQRLFSREDRRPVKTMYDFFVKIYRSDRENDAMRRYIRENIDCEQLSKVPSKTIIRRYGLEYHSANNFAWYLLEKYFNGEAIIKEKDAQPK